MGQLLELVSGSHTPNASLIVAMAESMSISPLMKIAILFGT